MAELIPYKKENVLLRLREGSIAEKWYAGFLGYERVSTPDRDPEAAPLIAEPLVSQDHRKFKTTSDKSDLVIIREGIENEGQSAGDSGSPQNMPQSASLSGMKKEELLEYAYNMGLDLPDGLTKNQIIEAIKNMQ